MSEAISQLLLEPMEIPYGQMECLTSDSLLAICPWKNAKLKLVHYVDSAQCSTCYLQHIKMYDILFRLETDYDNAFVNVFVIDPGKKDKERLYSEFSNGLLPKTLFIDTTHVFEESNPKIPRYSILHTFLLDENNKVILVGSPLATPEMMEKLLSVVDDRLGKKKRKKK
jgi:hypothetical protein